MSSTPVIEDEDFIDTSTMKMPNANKKIFVKDHPRYKIELEFLDEELDAFMLYKLKSKPIDMNDFMILFQNPGGVNLLKHIKFNNVSLPL